MSNSEPAARAVWAKRKCPECHELIEIQESSYGVLIDCPLCKRAIVIQSTGTAIKEGAIYTRANGHRAVDILHLATAIHLSAEEFLSFDGNQRKLATAEGLKVKP